MSKYYWKEIVLNMAVTTERKGLSGMSMVPSTLSTKYMFNSDISAIRKKEQIAEPRAQATHKARLGGTWASRPAMDSKLLLFVGF